MEYITDHERFHKVREEIAHEYDCGAAGGIGTLSEKTLHKVLKYYLEPIRENREVKIGSFVADIVGENGIVEIQTGGFQNLRKKMEAFLAVTTMTIVYPIAQTKWIQWLDPESGELSERRKSPKKGSPYDAFFELYKIKMFLNHPNLRIRLMMIESDEIRWLNGWSADRKRGSWRYNRTPTALISEMRLNGLGDYSQLIPAQLPEHFTSEDYRKATSLKLSGAQRALNVLHHVGAVIRSGKEGQKYLYCRT